MEVARGPLGAHRGEDGQHRRARGHGYRNRLAADLNRELGVVPPLGVSAQEQDAISLVATLAG